MKRDGILVEATTSKRPWVSLMIPRGTTQYGYVSHAIFNKLYALITAKASVREASNRYLSTERTKKEQSDEDVLAVCIAVRFMVNIIPDIKADPHPRSKATFLFLRTSTTTGPSRT